MLGMVWNQSGIVVWGDTVGLGCGGSVFQCGVELQGAGSVVVLVLDRRGFGLICLTGRQGCAIDSVRASASQCVTQMRAVLQRP